MSAPEPPIADGTECGAYSAMVFLEDIDEKTEATRAASVKELVARIEAVEAKHASAQDPLAPAEVATDAAAGGDASLVSTPKHIAAVLQDNVTAKLRRQSFNGNPMAHNYHPYLRRRQSVGD